MYVGSSRVIAVIFLVILGFSCPRLSAQPMCADAHADEAFQFDCFSILVGKDAGVDDAVLMAHNEGDGGKQVVN